MKIIQRGQPARDALQRGINLVADCVKVTLGPTGRNAVIGKLDIPPDITNDGVTIARNIEAEDETEQLGVMAMKEALSITDNTAGDGTTTTSVLLQKIVETLFEQLKDDGSLITKRVDAMKLSKELDSLCEQVVAKLTERARVIGNDDIFNVALVSAEYEWLAKMITEVFEKVGVDGFVDLEEGVKTESEVYPGIEIHSGVPSDYFFDENTRQTVLLDPYILVTNQKLELLPIANLLESLPKDSIEKKAISIILIAPEFTLDLVKRMIATKIQFGVSIIPIKLPTFDKDDVLVDIATLTEATFLDKNMFLKGEDFIKATNFGQLGQVKKAIITSEKTILIGGDGDTTARIADIKALREKTESPFDKHRMDERIAHLSGGFAKIRIGGRSDTEKKYYKLKAEDAINAVRGAMKSGVVKGGGLALMEIADELGETILTPALYAPYLQIQENAGHLEIGDNVLDPVQTTIAALQTACSLAGKIITTEVTIAFKHERPEPKS